MSENQNRAVRGRKARYQIYLSVRVPAAMKAEIDSIADAWDEDVSEVVRLALKAGLPTLYNPEAEGTKEVQLWWESLSAQERSKWGKRLRHIEGAAFRQEAYRRAKARER